MSTLLFDLPIDLSVKGNNNRAQVDCKQHQYNSADQWQQELYIAQHQQQYWRLTSEINNNNRTTRNHISLALFCHNYRWQHNERVREESSPLAANRRCGQRKASRLNSPSSSSASSSPTSSLAPSPSPVSLVSSSSGRANEKRERPLTGRHIKQGTGASKETLATLRKLLGQRIQK